MPKPNVKDFTGAVNILADITPTTREPIEQVTPDKWHTMDINQLWDQRIVLHNRSIKALQSGHMEISQQIDKGINSLDALIQYRSDQAEETAAMEESKIIY